MISDEERRHRTRSRSDGAGPFPSGAAAPTPDSGRTDTGRKADPEAAARDICLRMLTMSPRTRVQLADALRRKQIPEPVIEQVLGRLGEVGLVDDEAFARAWVQSRHAGRGLAKRALAAELRRRGVEDETVDQAVSALEPGDEERTAHRLVARRLGATRGLDPAKRMRRLAGMLARKGYAPGLAYRVVRDALAEEGADLDELPDEDVAGP